MLTEQSPIAMQRVAFSPNPIDYERGWELQREIHEAVVERRAPDTVLLLEHNPVYTAGRRTDPLDRPFDGTPVVDVDRGGKITWHGPGQLVAYPIVRLPDTVFVVDYVRRLEAAIIATCRDLGLTSVTQIPGRSGVWVPDDDRPARKVAAIGVRVARGVTLHGLAINCDCDLTWFDRIVPCGIRDAGVTSLTVECGRQITVSDALPVLENHLANLLSGADA